MAFLLPVRAGWSGPSPDRLARPATRGAEAGLPLCAGPAAVGTTTYTRPAAGSSRRVSGEAGLQGQAGQGGAGGAAGLFPGPGPGGGGGPPAGEQVGGGLGGGAGP